MALVRIQLRRDTSANWTAANPVLAVGEPGVETDSGRFKIGDGVRNWAALPYAAGSIPSDNAPPAVGVAAAGTSTLFARADHSHAVPASLSVAKISAGSAEIGGNIVVSGQIVGGAHKHSTEDITKLGSAISSGVAATLKAGTNVTLTTDPVSGQITVSSTATPPAGVASVSGRSGDVVLSTADLTDLPPVAGNSGKVLSTDGTGLKWATQSVTIPPAVSSLNTFTGAVTIVAGANVTLSQADNKITIAAPTPTGTGSVTSVNSINGGVTITADSKSPLSVTTAGSTITIATSGLSDVATSGLYSDLKSVPTAFAPSAHTHAATDVTGLAKVATSGSYADLAGIPSTFDPSTHTHNSSGITDFSEAVQDVVGQSLVAGSGVKVTYDDSANLLTVSSDDLLDAGYLDAGSTFVPQNLSLAVTPPPVVEVDSGDAMSLNVTASGGSLAYSYQWQVRLPVDDDWANVSNSGGYSGATSSRLSFSPVTATLNNARYRVKVSDGDSTITSAATRLRVSYFDITDDPNPVTAIAGSTTPPDTFTVVAESDDPITYQWQLLSGTTWTNISGATSASYGNIVVALPQSGPPVYTYRCVVTSAGAVLQSLPATLTVLTAPVTITTHPTNATAVGGAATFTAAFTGGTSPSVRWQVQRPGSTAWNDVPSATSTTLSLVGLTPSANGNKYRMLVTSQQASVASNAAVLTIGGPVITTEPLDAVTVTASASFSFSYSGGSGSVQWWKRPVGQTNWTSIAGATATTLSLTALSGTDTAHEYSATVTISGITVRTRAALLTVVPNATFSLHPQSVQVLAGQVVTLSFNTLFERAFPRYQWWEVTNTPSLPSGTWQEVPGTRVLLQANVPHTSYSFSARPEDSGKQFRAAVQRLGLSGPTGQVARSEPATVTVSQSVGDVVGALPSTRPRGMRFGGSMGEWDNPRTESSTGGPAGLHRTYAHFAHGRGTVVGVSHGGVNPGGKYNFIGANYPTSSYIYSTDEGANWSTGSLPASAVWTGIAWGRGRFVAVGVGGTAGYGSLVSQYTGTRHTTYDVIMASSEDGISWTSRVIDRMEFDYYGERTSLRGPRVAYGGGSFLISAGLGTYRTDGWSAPVRRTESQFEQALFIAGVWVFVSNGLRYSSNEMITSSPLAGINISSLRRSNFTGPSQAQFISSDTKAAILGRDALYTSTDGINWTREWAYYETVYSGGEINNSEFISAAMGGGELIYSTAMHYRPSRQYLTQPPLSSQFYYGIFRCSVDSPAEGSVVELGPSSAVGIWFGNNLYSQPGIPEKSHFLATSRYFLAINPAAGTVNRFPLAVTESSGEPAGGPSAPQQVTATTLSTTSVRLDWVAPQTSSLPITDYRVERTASFGRKPETWTVQSRTPSTSTTHTITGLTANLPYVFRVAAITSAGVGPYSIASAVAIPSTVASGAPTSAAAVLTQSHVGNPQVPGFSLSWTAPASNGGSTITSYSVQYRSKIEDGSPWLPSDQWSPLPERDSQNPADRDYYLWATVSGVTATVSGGNGLRPGLPYVFQFRVAAINDQGAGPYAETNTVSWSSAALTALPPAAPSSVSVSLVANPMSLAGSPGLSATWDSTPGGGEATAYKIQYRYQLVSGSTRGSFTGWSDLAPRNTTSTGNPSYRTWATVSGTTASISIGGLRPATTYGLQVRVAGMNAAGAGPYAESNVVDWISS